MRAAVLFLAALLGLAVSSLATSIDADHSTRTYSTYGSCGRNSCRKHYPCLRVGHRQYCTSPKANLGGICRVGNFFRRPCRYGLCLRTGSVSRCFLVRGEGHTCNRRRYRLCGRGLTCVHGRCRKVKLPENAVCTAAGSVCQDGLLCVGRPSLKKCKKPMPIGGSCGGDPFWVCEPGVDCVNNKCVAPKIPVNGNCKFEGAVCEDGLVCVGNNRRKECRKPMPLGKRCGTDPFWVCEEGLECVDHTCVNPVIPENGSCIEDGSRCEEGLVCAGNDDRKLCRKPMPQGGKCWTDPFWVCAKGLKCIDNICNGPPLPENSDCLPAGSRCEDGLVCIGTDSNKRCKELIPEGDACTNSPFSVCEDGLKCDDRVCTRPPVPEGGNCLPDGSECEEGLVCVGTEEEKQCKKPMLKGEECEKNPFSVCAEGLDCIDNMCFGPPKEKGPCNAPGTRCVDGLVCVGPDGRKICKKPMGVGEKCEVDPYWVCEEGLECRYKVCAVPH